jgi:hypothetical protein
MLSASTRPKCYPPKFRNWPNFNPRMTSACLYPQVHDFLIQCSKSNANVTIEGSYNIQRFFIFATHPTSSLHINVGSLLLLIPTHHRLEVWQLLEVHLLSLEYHIYTEIHIFTEFNNLISITCLFGTHGVM